MKTVTVSLIDTMFKTEECHDNPMFTLYLADVPNTGDYLFIDDCKPVAHEDQSVHFYRFCLDNLPKPRFGGFRFKVVERIIHRYDLASHINLDLQFGP